MAPDWRNPADYEALARLDLASLAWEFLRRNPAYRLEMEGRPESREAAAGRWGLRFAVSPDLPAVEAPLFWRAEAAPAHVLILTRSRAGGVTAGELQAACVAVRSDGEGTHLRLAGGLQVVAPAGIGPGEPLAAETPLDRRLAARLSGLAGLQRLLAGRRGPAAAPLSALGRRRVVQMLRAADGRAAGASYRDIAEGVLGTLVDPLAWRTSSARDVAIRLCRSAARLVGGGYRGLLLRRR